MEEKILKVAWEGDLDNDQTVTVLKERGEWTEEDIELFKTIVPEISTELNEQIAAMKEKMEVAEDSVEEIIGSDKFDQQFDSLLGKLKDAVYEMAEGEESDVVAKILQTIENGEELSDEEIAILAEISETAEAPEEILKIVGKLVEGEGISDEEKNQVKDFLQGKEYPYPAPEEEPEEKEPYYPYPSEEYKRQVNEKLGQFIEEGWLTRHQAQEFEKIIQALNSEVQFKMEDKEIFEKIGNILEEKTQSQNFQKMSKENSSAIDLLKKTPKRRG